MSDDIHPLRTDWAILLDVVGVASSSPVRWIDIVYERLGIDAFDAVVSADHVDRGKPAPDVYELALERLGTRPTEGVAVEDSRHGVRAATDAGLSCIGYATRTPRTALAGADHVGSMPWSLHGAVREAVGLGT